MGAIGQPLRRIEDRPLVTGRGRYAADNNAPGQLHMRMVRSPVAFGRLRGVNLRAARAVPGVAAIWTWEDVKELPPIDFRVPNRELEPFRQSVLAHNYVRYVGEPVAAVFADDAYAAEDAAELVEVDIDELAPYLDPTMEPPEFMPGTRAEAAVLRKACGDIDAAFSGAHAVIELDLAVGRHTGTPLETRGVFARVDPASGTLVVEGAAKAPHFNCKAIAGMMDLPLEMVRFHEGHVGGGFGIRGDVYPEDVLVCLCAWRLKRPVKWTEDRHEHLVAANHSRDQRFRLRAAVGADGMLLGLDAVIFSDQGAYARTPGLTAPDMACAMLPGPYLVPAYRAVAHVRLTNKTPAGTYRSPGRYESTFARERLMDAIAARTGLDGIEVRRRNLIPKSRMPFGRGIISLGVSIEYDSGDYAGLLERLLASIEYPALRADLSRRKAAGERVGFGLACFVEKTGRGPADRALIEARPDGSVEIVTGAASGGQGVETAMAQIASDVLGVPIERINVVHGQTDRIDAGLGAFASRVTVMTGCAVHAAAEALRSKAIETAAAALAVAPDKLRLSQAVVHGPNGASVSLADVAARSLAGGAPLAAEGRFRSDHMTYPYGIHAAVVRVDTGTCGVHVERFAIAYDIGRAVNPMLVEGQLVGGAAQGLGGALYEEFVYDEAGQPQATTFADYLIPTLAEVPPVQTLITEDAPSLHNPLGIKGVGEAGLTGAGAAIAAAIDDALERPGAVTRLPVTPMRLHALLNDGGRIIPATG
ncbi:MAG: xanthine dehydrogenase family protein [Betaproteobacteria bacterium]|nr:xanthine dehydrogenase family protein [Betaproteobacteria bacterium]MBI2960424.1 xanthine dehydrogenase family protein [Betaproteobacteria bacterium]